MIRLPDLVRRSAERYPHAVALAPVHGPGVGASSYTQLQTLMERGAAVLRSLNLTPGDRVILFLESCAAWPVAFFSILEAGLVAVPLPAEAPVASVAGAAAFAGARIAIVSQRTAALSNTGIQCLPIEQLLYSESAASDSAGPWPEAAVLAFTSGSTHQPRAVELTHANLLANLHTLLQVRQAAPGDSFLSMLPPAHLFELMVGLLGPLACGARIVFASSLLPHRILAFLRDERITHALSVPALLEVVYGEVVAELVDAGMLDPMRRDQGPAEAARQLRQQMNESDLELLRTGIRERVGTSLHTLVVGGAALDPAWAELTAAIGLRLEVGYGLTEASPIVSLGLASASFPGSVGRPLPGVEVRVAEDGEILVRGPNVMRGYFRDAEATAAALKDHWLYTGDHGYLDENGLLYITGRLKEVMVTASGETLYPEEVESYYNSPLFAERCVAGLPDSQGNDLPALFVVPTTPDIGDADLQGAFEELRAAAPPRLRVPRLIRLTGSLPRTALGKVRRRTLAQEWLKNESRNS